MADRKISDLVALTTPAAGDYLPIVDISEASAANKNKRITIEELLRGAPDGTAAAPSIAFESDGGNGLYLAGTDTIGVSTNGVNRLTLSTTAFTSTLPIVSPLGAAATPSFTFTGDLNTGIYSPGADQVAVATNGTGRLFVDSSGRVGIGNSSPGSLLTVRSGSSPTVSIENNTSTGPGVVLFRSGGANYGLQDRINIKGLITDSATGATALTVETSTGDLASPAERLRITSAGLVGVGTSTPDNKLSVGIASADEGVELKATYNGSRVARFGLVNPGVDNTPYIGSVAGNDFGFITSNTRRMTLDASGRLGIGTTSPQEELHIVSAWQPYIQVQSTGGATGSAYFGFNSSTGSASIESSESIRFAIPGSEAARIDTSGRLLVGTSSSRNIAAANQRLIQVESASGDGGISIVRNSNDTTGGRLVLGKSRGTAVGSNTVVQNGDDLGGLIFAGADGTNIQSWGAEILAVVDGTPGVDDLPTRLVFSVTADGASSPTEALRISQNRAITVSDGGNVVLGTTTGTKIGTSTSQKIGFFNETPIVQPTTGVAEAAFVENSGGTAVNVDSTFGGYTIQQVVQALQNLGLLA